MRFKSALKAAALGIFGVSTLATTLWAQGAGGGPGTPWRGAGVQPCFGPEGGSYQCPPVLGVTAVRAGRLFDSKSGRMLTNQVVVLQGERITEGRLDGPRFKVSGRGIGWGAAPAATAVSPLVRMEVRSVEEARAAVREHVERGVDWIKLFPGGAYSFTPTGDVNYVTTYPLP